MSGKHSLDRQGIWLIAGSLFVMGLVAGLVAWRETCTPTLDPATLRVLGKPISGEVAILLDVTDPPSPKELAVVTEWLRELELTELLPNERVTLWVLGAGQTGALERTFSRCYPGRESDRLFHNPAASAARCDSLFTRPLRRAVAQAGAARRSPRSPILEAVREIASQAEFVRGCRRRLVLASDLYENTAVLSFYSSAPTFRAFQRSPLFLDVRADLRGVAVDVLYLSRGTWDVGRPDLRNFWRSYLTSCGAESVSFRRL